MIRTNLTLIIVLFYFNAIAQYSFDSLFNEGANAFGNNNFDSAIESFKLASEEDSIHADTYTYLGYSWFQKHNFDSSIYYLTKSISIDSTNAEVYFARGISLISTSTFTSHNSCNDLRKAKQLGYEDEFLESQLKLKCWKYDEVYIRSEGLKDSTIIDNVYSVLPKNWSILEFVDQNSFKESVDKTEQLLNYYIVLINRETPFMDYRFSEETIPEMTVLIGDRSLKKAFSKQLKNNKKNLMEGEILNTEIFDNGSYILVFRWNTEFRISNFAPEHIRLRYFKDKQQIIELFMDYKW